MNFAEISIEFLCLETFFEISIIDFILTQREHFIDDIPDNTVFRPVYKVEDSRDPKFRLGAYRAIDLLGKGGFSKVYLVRKYDTGKIYAMKIISKKYAAKWAGELVKREFDLMKESQHPLIVKLKYVFPTDTTYNFVMEFCPGGTLYSQLKKCRRFDQRRALIYFAEILMMIRYLHEKNILFRDLKVNFCLTF